MLFNASDAAAVHNFSRFLYFSILMQINYNYLHLQFSEYFLYYFYINAVISVCRYRALYDYKPVNADELELTCDDIINVVEICDDGWYVGFIEKTDKFGTFPGNYVKPLWSVFLNFYIGT